MKATKKINKTSIVIIEDNRLLREGITSLINEQPELKVVGAFSERENALTKIFELKPDIVLIDLGLRSQNSLRVVKSIKQRSEKIKIIVMDLMPIENDILDFVKAGASGFILKDAKVHEFIKTINAVAAGEKILPTHMTGSLFNQIIDRAVNGTTTSDLEQAVKMTKRERQVIELIADGLANKEIGKLLNLSPFTVKSHVHNILEKMALHSRVQIATYAHTSKEFKETNPKASENNS
ncbi:MAG: response regulator transcription factor [Bacteroidetes bacterium]|nr:response regulator transcription factor [Bacteroidota bacterium]